MPDVLTQDIIKHSVTEADVMEYQGRGVVNFVMPYFWATPRVFSLPTDLPPYWSFQRDVILRSSILHESFWASAVAIAATKVAAQSFDVTGDIPARVKAAQRMMVQWGGAGYVPSQEAGMLDYTCTDNGEFHEVVRQSSAAGSRILGLVHLDSLRCQRTGDPSIPILFRDLKDGLHEMRDYQVINLVDMPDPGYSWLGVGHCAAERAYNQVYKQSGIDRTLSEKVTGAGAHQLAFVQGMNSTQLDGIIKTADGESKSKGLQYYLGTILAGVMGDAPIDIKTLQLRGLPENFEYKDQLDVSLLAYANALGLVLTDLQPLSGQGLGTGKQAETLEDKSRGRGLAARNKQLTHLLNEWVMPDAVTFFFHERDYRDELQQAQVTNAREEGRNSMISNQQITPAQGLQMAVDADDVPREFLPVDATPDASLGDEERSNEIDEPVDGEVPPLAPLADATPVKVVGKEAIDVEIARRRFASIPLSDRQLIDLGFDNDDLSALNELRQSQKEIDYAAIKAQLLGIKEALSA